MFIFLKQKLKEPITAFLIRRSRYFDEDWYRKHSPYPPTASEDAVLHYLRGGWRNCDPSSEFSNNAYVETNTHVNGLCPLAHYVVHGKREGRPITGGIAGVSRLGIYRPLTLLRSIRRAWGRLVCQNMVRRNRNARILVCLQMFYPHSWSEIKEYMKNLAPYSYDLVIAYQDFGGFDKMIADIRAFKPEAKFISVANLGFDIGAFHTSLSFVDLSNYDIVFKLHSKGVTRKRLYMYGQFFRKRDWFLYLFEGILGARNVHIAIDRLLNDAHCGLVALNTLLVHDPTHKQNLLKRTLSEMNVPMKVPEDYRFVAGTCFAEKAVLLKPFQNLSLEYAPSRRRLFSLAHCMERALCFSAQQNGFRFWGTKACLIRALIRRYQGKPYSNSVVFQLLKDDRIILDDEFVYNSLESRRYKGYDLVPIRLGDIRRRWFNGEDLLLKECAPYQYLTGDETVYEEYCRYHLEHELPMMTRERFNRLIKSIEEHGYDKRYVIVVNRDNIILDGQHRACCLLKMYGEDYMPTVLKLY